MTPLRETCDQPGLFDQIKSKDASETEISPQEKELQRIRELDERLAKLDQLKQELVANMTKPSPRFSSQNTF